MGSRWTWRLVALPGVVWLSIFFLCAFYAVLAVAFGNQDTLSQPVPHWNPLDWNIGYVVDMFDNLFHGGPFWTVSLRTIEFVALAVGLSLLVGYPVAYFTARHAGRWKGAILLALILPLWINYLMRMLAWINLLAPDGIGSRFLHNTGIEWLFLQLGLLAEPGGWLNGQPTTVDPRAALRLHPVSSSCRCSSRSTASTAARSTRPATSVPARRARSSA